MDLQTQYDLILEGKGNKDFFMKSIKRIFPQYINQYTTFENAVTILKNKSIISERFIGGLVTGSKKQPDWFSIFKENISEAAKAEEKETTKEATDMTTRGYDYKDVKNIDNIYGPQFLTGYYAEMKDPKNSEKTVEELKQIVAKNLAKDIMYYTKEGQFGVKGLGYKESTPTKEVKGKYKASGYEKAPDILKENIYTHPMFGRITDNPQTNIKTPEDGGYNAVEYSYNSAKRKYKFQIDTLPDEELELFLKEKGVNPSSIEKILQDRKNPIKEGSGSDIGDKVYFRGDVGEIYPSSQGYYGIIEDYTPARNYNMNAIYIVTVYDKNDNEIRTIRGEWGNFSTKPINELEARSIGSMVKPSENEFESDDVVLYKGIKHKVTRIADDGRIYIKSIKFGGRPEVWVKAQDLKKAKTNESLEEQKDKYKPKIGDTLIKNGKKGKVVKVMDDMVNVDFGNGDVYGIVLRRIQGNQIVNEHENLDLDYLKHVEGKPIAKHSGISYEEYLRLHPDTKKQLALVYFKNNKLKETQKEPTTPAYFDNLEDAKKYADKYGEGQYAVHVNKIRDDKYVVEDWYDSDNTVYSALDESSGMMGDYDGSGLIVKGRTPIDNNAIKDMLGETDYYGVWNPREGYWFFPEDEETLDSLESELESEFNQRGITVRFESQFNESNPSYKPEIGSTAWNKENTYMISKSGPKKNPVYVLEKPDGSKQIDMFFDTPEQAKKYANKKNLKIVKSTISEDEACWKGYKQIGIKSKNGKQVPNCVPVRENKSLSLSNIVKEIKSNKNLEDFI